LREALQNLNRAREIVITRCSESTDIQGLEATIKKFCGDIPIRHADHVPTHIIRLAKGEIFPLDFLQDQHIHAACAIAQPETFFETLEKLGAIIDKRNAYPDHTQIPETLFQGNTAIFITEKDAVRIPYPPDNVYALAISLIYSGIAELHSAS